MLNLVRTTFAIATDINENIRQNVKRTLGENEEILYIFKCLNIAAFFTTKRMIFTRIDETFDTYEDVEFISYKCIQKYTISNSEKENNTNVTLCINHIPIFLTGLSFDTALGLVQHISNLT